jgi:hypothetical protein
MNKDAAAPWFVLRELSTTPNIKGDTLAASAFSFSKLRVDAPLLTPGPSASGFLANQFYGDVDISVNSLANSFVPNKYKASHNATNSIVDIEFFEGFVYAVVEPPFAEGGGDHAVILRYWANDLTYAFFFFLLSSLANLTCMDLLSPGTPALLSTQRSQRQDGSRSAPRRDASTPPPRTMSLTS